jgi:hypothetical protein
MLELGPSAKVLFHVLGNYRRANAESCSTRIASFREFWPYYVGEHVKATTRTLHFIGSTLVLAIAAIAVVTGRPWLLLAMPVAGYAFAWAGHFGFEKNRPTTFKYPVYSFLADWVMYGKILSGTMRAEVDRAVAKS